MQASQIIMPALLMAPEKAHTLHLDPGLNASTVQLVLHIWQGYLTFSSDFIFDRIVSVLATFH